MEKAETENLVKNGKYFCVLPWVHFHAWPDKRVLPCCVADSGMPVSEIKDDQSIIDMMNSPDYKKLRLAMMNDEPVEACKRCYDLEMIGTWTMRQSHNKRKGVEYVDYISENTNNDGSLKDFHGPRLDWLALGGRFMVEDGRSDEVVGHGIWRSWPSTAEGRVVDAA